MLHGLSLRQRGTWAYTFPVSFVILKWTYASSPWSTPPSASLVCTRLLLRPRRPHVDILTASRNIRVGAKIGLTQPHSKHL